MDISVIIPVYNSAGYIGEALESVYKQTAKIHEVICIDDASTDNSSELIKKNYPKVRLLQNDTNMGPSYSRNRGINAANGSIISFLDADDLWPDDKTEWQINELVQKESLMLVGGQTKIFTNDPQATSQENDEHFNSYLASFLIKKSVFKKVGLFDKNMRLSEDQDWFLRVREAGISLKVVNRLALLKREHTSNTTYQLSFGQTDFIMALKKSLDRRRANNAFVDLDRIEIEGNSKNVK